MTGTNRKLDKLLRRERLKRLLIWGPLGGALAVGFVAFMLLTRDPTSHVAYVTGTLDDTIVERGYDGVTVYWLIALPDGSRAQLLQPGGAEFRAGRQICLDVREGDWSGRNEFNLALPEHCSGAEG